MKPVLLLRAEDLVLAGWVAIASPLLFRVTGDKGPFDSGQTLEGLLRLGAVLGVLACLAARRQVEGNGQGASMLNRGVVGPFVGGLLFVTIAGFSALNAGTTTIYAGLLVAALVMVLVRVAVPPLRVVVRRALVSPFVAVAAGLYWNLIEAVIGTPGAAAVRNAVRFDPHSSLPVLAFLIAFSGVYYAMLIYAPRQVADREGGAVEWLLRFATFAVSIALGIGWLSILAA